MQALGICLLRAFDRYGSAGLELCILRENRRCRNCQRSSACEKDGIPHGCVSIVAHRLADIRYALNPRRQLPPEPRPWVHEREWEMNGEVSASVALCQRYWYLKTWIMAGPRMTTNSTGRKNIIIGTVSLGGNAAAFFSASDMRMSRFSRAITRKAWPTGVP
jgi:hypothetical protein